jgi:hypothetical protein
MSSTREVVDGFTDEQIDTLLRTLDPLITANYLGRLTEDCYELTAFLPSESAGIEAANAWRRVPYLIRQLRAALQHREQEVREAAWLPIESAPRDSSWILAVARTGRQFIVRWGGGAWEDDNRLCRDPVYWQPLPLPPTIRRDDTPQEGEQK